jgi:GT2 family glycosyltransferase
VFQPQLGLSNARNAAVDAAKGELILWTDDDVLVDAGWLEAYVAAAQRWPDAGFFGGPIEPSFEQQPPAWVSENLRLLQGVLVIRNLGERETILGKQLPYGANMAFRRHALGHNCFDPLLGPNGTDRFAHDETTVMRRLQAAGAKGVWVPAAKVVHYVPASRMTLKYAWHYLHGAGRTDIRMDGVPEGKPWWGAPRWLYKRYCQLVWKYRLLRALARPAWLAAFLEAAHVSGMIHECRTQPS